MFLHQWCMAMLELFQPKAYSNCPNQVISVLQGSEIHPAELQFVDWGLTNVIAILCFEQLRDCLFYIKVLQKMVHKKVGCKRSSSNVFIILVILFFCVCFTSRSCKKWYTKKWGAIVQVVIFFFYIKATFFF